MFEITKKELHNFRNNGKRILKEVHFKVGDNPARQWYRYKNPAKQAKNYFVILLCKILPPCEMKNGLYRLIGVQIGKNVSIANDVILDTIFPELIKIEDNAMIGWGTKLYTHEFALDKARIGTIIIGKNSMVGEWSIVRPGIRMGKNSMIAAMSFVNEDVGDNVLEGGVPIHIIKHYEKMRKSSRRGFVS